MREGKHEHKGHKEYRDNYGHAHDDNKKNFQSAQTFRRGRAIAFLDRMNIKRSTLLQQLDQPEYESIRQVICGELKATDTIIQEFIQAFELREVLAEQNIKIEGAEINHDHS